MSPSSPPDAPTEPSGSPDGGSTALPPAAPEPSRGSFAMAAVVTGFALYLTYGLVVMDANEGGDGGPGPRFFPVLVLVLAWVVAVGLALDAVRERRRARPRGAAPESGAGAGDDRPTAPTDWRSVALVAGTFAVFTAVLVPLGWLIAGTWLFWGTAQALGSRRRLFDLGVALAVASVVQLAFGAGLGLNLPAGLLAL
ncbi:tripartite tricarboxylate transporter TctB family protein [Kineococcus arenarius]|uniref:tripartite tricarboxylate transporter TctB family protein n=1 Tax=unclassified Kineococcus TaxID=2621656 RepID=UPI003D7D9CC7